MFTIVYFQTGLIQTPDIFQVTIFNAQEQRHYGWVWLWIENHSSWVQISAIFPGLIRQGAIALLSQTPLPYTESEDTRVSNTRVVLRLAYHKHQMLLQCRPSWESRDTSAGTHGLPEDMAVNSWHRSWQYSGFRTTCTLKGELRNKQPGVDVARWVRPAQTQSERHWASRSHWLPPGFIFLVSKVEMVHLPHKTVRWMRNHSWDTQRHAW